MNKRLEPTNIAVIGNELAIAWNDGKESYLGFELLRRSCPCAECCGEPDALGNLERPEVRYGPGSFDLRGWRLVGGYSWQPTWGDGHGSGLYAFKYLRKLSGEG